MQVDGEDEALVIELTDKKVERLVCIEENNLTLKVDIS